MTVLKICLGAFGLALALSGGLRAETSPPPAAPAPAAAAASAPAAGTPAAPGVGDSLVALLGQERRALGAVRSDALDRMVAEPVVRGKLFSSAAVSRPSAPDRPSAADGPSAAGVSPALTRTAAATQVRRERRGAGPARVPDEAEVTDPAWLAAQPAPAGDSEFRCLATALYFEARGESLAGQAAVAEVILNRRDSAAYPRSICGVVNQRGAGGCAFSFACDGRSDAVTDMGAWDRAARIARAMLDGAPRQLTRGATHFHTPAVRPAWAGEFTRTAAIGAHLFYRAPLRGVAVAASAPAAAVPVVVPVAMSSASEPKRIFSRKSDSD